MRSLKILALLAAMSASAWMLPQEACAQQASVSFQLFYDQLSPYGMWVDYPNYGYVWIPNVDPGFSPYATGGYWVLTDDGWTWVSDYSWGWATFHYGRWDYDDNYGWFWVPDNEWGPAWVSWRRSPGYYGWAPMRPGISISMSFGSDYHERNERWNFVRDRDITRRDIGSHYVNRANNAAIINRSTVIVDTRKDTKRNATYMMGPNRDDVQRVTNTPVKSVAIRDANKPGHQLSNGELQIYRPQVQKRNGAGQQPAPSKVTKLNEVRPALEKNAGNRQPGVNPSIKSGKEKQPQTVTPIKSQPPQKVAPPTKTQPQRPRAVAPSNNRGRAPQTATRPIKSQPPQKVAPPTKNREEQPSPSRSNQAETEKRKRD